MKKWIAALALATAPVAGLQAMNVAVFLEKADRLEKKGMAAMFSGDLRILKREIETASGQLRAERIAAQRAGRRAAFCPPPKVGLKSGEILGYFRAIPAAQRPGTEVKNALRGLLARKFPCRT
jgi:hypothetical protein